MTSALSVPESSLRGVGRGIVLVDEIGKAELVLLVVVEGDEEIAGRQQLADDLVDAPEQRQQVLGRSGAASEMSCSARLHRYSARLSAVTSRATAIRAWSASDQRADHMMWTTCPSLRT